MSGWKTTTLHNKIHIKHGFAFKGEFFADEGKYVVLTPGNFFELGGFKRQIGKEKYYSGSIPQSYIHKRGDLIVAMTEQTSGLLGSCAIVPRDNLYLHNQRLGLITVNEEEIDKTFIYHLFKTKSVREQIRLTSTGSKVKHTAPERIYDVKVELPPKLTQQKIATVLNAIDEKIELNNTINAQLETMAKMLYDYWFVQFNFPDEVGRPYKSSGGKMVYSEFLKRKIPVGWKTGSLWDIADYFNGLAMQKFRPKTGESLPVIKIREMNDGISESTERCRADIVKGAIVNDGDILFAWSASLDVKIWSQGRGGLNQHIFKVTSDKYPKFFYYFELINYLSHFQMMAQKRKTTMGHITQDHLKQSRICIPPLSILEEAEKQINPLLDKHLNQEKENVAFSQLHDWLLPLLMNGQVTVE